VTPLIDALLSQLRLKKSFGSWAFVEGGMKLFLISTSSAALLPLFSALRKDQSQLLVSCFLRGRPCRPFQIATFHVSCDAWRFELTCLLLFRT
jgi:hypothetical protein